VKDFMDCPVAYFTMEIAVAPDVPTYSGGLGLLAGDMIRAAADLKVPITAVSLLYRRGYLRQRLDDEGSQFEEPVTWNVNEHLREMPVRVSVTIEGRTVHLRAWRYDVAGVSGFTVPVYLLDTDVPENAEQDRTLSHQLYGGDMRVRLSQEVVLGIGGVRMLRALGYDNIHRYHMNEGHASLLVLELLDEETRRSWRTSPTHDDVLSVRKQCVFTTHTPVSAGHDQFSTALALAVLGRQELFARPDLFHCNGSLNMTELGLHFSHYVNGVARRHGEVSQRMFPGFEIGWITNGVHPATWIVPALQQLFDKYLAGWQEHAVVLRNAFSIPDDALWAAHRQAKRELLHYAREATGQTLDEDVLTLGFARRFTGYKRPNLLLHDTRRLNEIAERRGNLQVVYAGKAHPNDRQGQELIRDVFRSRRQLSPQVRVAYIPDHDLRLGRLMTSGVDVWLNTPRAPLEASGTSGMKAAINGVPSLSVLDGWWLEGCAEGVTGWAIGKDRRGSTGPLDDEEDALSLYEKLDSVVMSLYYRDRPGFINVMRHAIAINGSFFNTHRMLQEYVLKAY
jgi:glycogen phosphorylase